MAPDYAGAMKASALPFRVLYAVVAAPVASIAVFYVAIFLFTRTVLQVEGPEAIDPGWREFVLSLLAAGAAGFTAFLFALTLPWHRLRRRKGRPLRITISAVVVLLISLIAAAEAVPLGYVAGVMVWLSVVLTFTFIRYGVLDSSRGTQGKPGL